jgi:DNA-damage-inducible protein D
MTKKNIAFHQNIFEQIKKTNEQGQEYWSARDLGKTLGYAEFRNFVPVIEKAKEACNHSGHNSLDPMPFGNLPHYSVL